MIRDLPGLFPSSPGQVALFILTVLAYLAARWLYLRSGRQAALIPVLTASAMVIFVLVLSDIAYPAYAQSNRLLQFLMGPATVALAIPLYSQLHQLRRMWRPLAVALFAGGVTAVVSSIAIAALFGGTLTTLLSVAPKSATMPIAMPASAAVGGLASLTGIACAITGISAVIMAGPLFRLLGTTDPLVRGFTLGLTAHAIGTADAIQQGPQATASAALAMGLNGLLTAVIIPFLPWLLRGLA